MWNLGAHHVGDKHCAKCKQTTVDAYQLFRGDRSANSQYESDAERPNGAGGPDLLPRSAQRLSDYTHEAEHRAGRATSNYFDETRKNSIGVPKRARHR